MFFDNTVLDVLARGFVLSGVALIWIILMVRIVGLNSFSKICLISLLVLVKRHILLTLK